MVGIDYPELQELLVHGFYHKVTDLGSSTFDKPEILFLVIEAYLELGIGNKAETLLNSIKELNLTNKESILKYYYLAKCQFLKNNYADSLESLEQGLNLVRQTTLEPLLEARLLISKGEVYWRQGKLEHAKDLITTAVEILKREHDKYYLAIALNTLGLILRGQKRTTEALQVHEQALKLREEFGNYQHIANSLNNIAVTYWTNGKLKVALSYLERALSLKDKVENETNIANWVTNIATIKVTQGFLYDGMQLHSEALILFEKSNNLPSIATIYCNIGEIYRHLGQLFEAKSKHEYALKLRINIGNPHYIAESIFYVTLVKFDMKIPINILEIQKSFHKSSYELPTVQAYYTMIQGLLAQQLGLLNDAIQYWQKTLNIGLLEFYFQTFCYEQLILALFKQWMNNPTLQIKTRFKEKLRNWELISQENNLVSNLCKIYLINAKLELTESRYENAEILLNQCIILAKENDLEYYLKLAEREKVTLNNAKDQLTKYTDITKKALERIHFDEISLYIKDINKMLERIQNKHLIP